MLALSRKVGQTIVIDQNIVVTVLSIRGSRITLGFSAPEDVSIRRIPPFQAVASVELLGETLPANTSLPLAVQ